MDGALTVEAGAERRHTARLLRVARWPLAARWVAAVVAACVVVAVSPSVLELLRHTPVLCPFRVLTGLPCPGCGTTRAVFELGSGRPITSLLLNPLGAFVWLYFLASLARWVGVLTQSAFEKARETLAAYGATCAFAAWLAVLAHRLLT